MTALRWTSIYGLVFLRRFSRTLHTSHAQFQLSSWYDQDQRFPGLSGLVGPQVDKPKGTGVHDPKVVACAHEFAARWTHGALVHMSRKLFRGNDFVLGLSLFGCR